MSVTVLLPVYNAAGTLAEAIGSILQQTHPDFELLIVDDGSTDGSADIVRSFDDPRIRLLSRQHEGLVAALNAGLAEITTPFFARMDADDVALPERLQCQIDWLQTHPEVAGVGCLVEMFPEAGITEGMRHYLDWLNSVVETEQIRCEIFVEMPLAHPSLCFRTQVVKDCGGYRQGNFPEDYELFLRMMQAGWQFGKVEQMLLRWREHDGRLSRRHAAYSPQAFRSLKAKYVADLIAETGDFTFWGAGRDGKLMLRELAERNCKPTKIIDIDPRKIGRHYLDVPIVAPEVLSRNDLPVFACVGSKGARAQIRSYLAERKYREGEDFWFLA